MTTRNTASSQPFKKYRILGKKGEGTFSEVLKAICLKDGKPCAIKCMKHQFESINQVNNLREIQALRHLTPHPHVIDLYEVLYDRKTGHLALVFELMDMNMYDLIRGRRHRLEESRVRMYMYQLFKSLAHMHKNGIFHRDIKPENILLSEDHLKLGDFGSCRGIYSKHPYTEYISTRWYRPPECLLTDGYYGHEMDIWSSGCVMFEVLGLVPLFPGANEVDQIHKIHDVMGTPSRTVLNKFRALGSQMDLNFAPKTGTGIANLLPHVSAECINLLSQLLAYDPDERITARQVLRHPYFRELRNMEKQLQRGLQPPQEPTMHDTGSSAPTTTDTMAQVTNEENRKNRTHTQSESDELDQASPKAQSLSATGTSLAGTLPIIRGQADVAGGAHGHNSSKKPAAHSHSLPLNQPTTSTISNGAQSSHQSSLPSIIHNQLPRTNQVPQIPGSHTQRSNDTSVSHLSYASHGNSKKKATKKQVKAPSKSFGADSYPSLPPGQSMVYPQPRQPYISAFPSIHGTSTVSSDAQSTITQISGTTISSNPLKKKTGVAMSKSSSTSGLAQNTHGARNKYISPYSQKSGVKKKY